MKHLLFLFLLPLFSFSQSVTTDPIEGHAAFYDTDMQTDDASNFTGFTGALLIGVRSEAVTLDTLSNRYSTNGMRYQLQLGGVNIKDGFGYTYGLQMSFSTHNLFIPRQGTSVSVNESIRNYEAHAFIGITDKYQNILGLRIGGGRVDSKEYRGHWDLGVVGALNLPLVDNSLYLGLQPQLGIKSNQLTTEGIAPYVELMLSVTKRL